MSQPDFLAWPDLASRRLGGSVVAANDDLFAEKENLVKPEAPAFAAADFGPRGKVYDGWETRRRREPGHDYAIVRLGVPGLVHGVVVDTAWFRGNYPPEISVEAVCAAGYPAPAELEALDWAPLVARTAAAGDTANHYAVGQPQSLDAPAAVHLPGRGRGPVPGARRAAGRPGVPDRHGGPGRAGARRAAAGLLRRVLRLGREPDHAGPGPRHGRRLGERPAARPGPRLRGVRAGRRGRAGAGSRSTPRTSSATPRAGSRSRAPGRAGGLARSPAQDPGPARHPAPVPGRQPGPGGAGCRLDVFPDGGLARLRVHGELTPESLAALRRRWQDALPQAQAAGTADGDR